MYSPYRKKFIPRQRTLHISAMQICSLFPPEEKDLSAEIIALNHTDLRRSAPSGAFGVAFDGTKLWIGN